MFSCRAIQTTSRVSRLSNTATTTTVAHLNIAQQQQFLPQQQQHLSRHFCRKFHHNTRQSQLSSTSGSRNSSDNTADYLRNICSEAVRRCEELPLAAPVDKTAVFANNELDLADIEAYGFDYDYTLAIYKFELNRLIYDLAMHRLIADSKYPYDLRDEPYDLKFAIRGLHFDTKECLLMKLDQFSVVQDGTCYRGKRPLSGKSVLDIYHRRSVSEKKLTVNGEIKTKDPRKAEGYQIETLIKQRKFVHVNPKMERFRQLSDLFSLPEIGLLCTVIDYFDRKQIDFDPLAVYEDVKESVKSVHLSGQMYRAVIEDPPKFLHKNEKLREFLQRLKAGNKRAFVITNSPYSFIEPGMRFMLGDDWAELFDTIVVQAKKPKFFQQDHRLFRQFNAKKTRLSYARVTQFEPGVIYTGGNVKQFAQLSGLWGKGVLYFGDHIMADLSDLMLNVGWHTGCIVPELSREIMLQNSAHYQKILREMLTMKRLIMEYQDMARAGGEESIKVLEEWKERKNVLRIQAKVMFNPQFGSMFRTFNCATYFSYRMNRLADVYTDRLPNLLNYSLEHKFYPSRNPLAHEMTTPLPDIQRKEYTIRP